MDTLQESPHLERHREICAAYSLYTRSLPYGGIGPLTRQYLGEMLESARKLTEDDKAILRKEILEEVKRAQDIINESVHFRVQDGSRLTQ